ncbi:MAG: DUF4256 domain-containing protein [Patescibacteria group bacterium]
MQTLVEKTAEATATPTIQDAVQNRIVALPKDLRERAKALREIEKQLGAGMELVRHELDTVLNQSLEKNMNPDEKVLAEISDRYALSSKHGVSREDFDVALGEISANEKALAQLRRLKATGAEMTITSVDASEILFIDTVDNVNVEAQETFLSELPQQERADAISNLQKRFPEIEQFLQRANSARGLNYYEYILICKITGAEPMSGDEYKELQKHKPVDRNTICWLLTEKEMLDRGVALYSGRDDHGVNVYEDGADYRYYFRAGRPRLRVQRA